MQQILCTAACMHRITFLYSESVALNVSIQRGCLHGYWLYKVVYLKKELFKFCLTATIMVSCKSCHLFHERYCVQVLCILLR